MNRILSALACALVISTAAVPPVWAADRTIGERIDDARITADIKAKLTSERAKNLVNVNVDTHDGIVHLQGSVPTTNDRALAERLARSTKGVRDVTDDLRVETPVTSPSASPGR